MRSEYTKIDPIYEISDHISLDRFDRGILSAFAENGFLSITELAQRIGLSKSSTHARLRRLEYNVSSKAIAHCKIRSN